MTNSAIAASPNAGATGCSPEARRAPKFAKDGGFRRDLQVKVDAYFAQTGLPERDVGAMYRKTVVILLAFLGTWLAMVFGHLPVYALILLAIAHGLSVAAIGMSIMHDANHGGYSAHPAVNHVLGWTLDFLGCSSWVWKTKHNTVHHTWTNMVGVDDDLEAGFLARMAPGQPRRPWHRLQHWYVWFLYALLLPKWVLVDDWYNLSLHRVGLTPLPPPPLRQWASLLLGKTLFILWSFVLPAYLHGFWPVLGLWLLASSTVGVVLGITFQLAHCVDTATFSEQSQPLTRDWAEHQLATTVDFAPGNRLLTWYVGGLNYQVVHHLFPRICHVHYPKMAAIIAQTAQDHGLMYRAQPTVWAALRSHVRWLRKMGLPTAA